jgi:hypothetical protein
MATALPAGNLPNVSVLPIEFACEFPPPGPASWEGVCIDAGDLPRYIAGSSIPLPLRSLVAKPHSNDVISALGIS